MKIVSVGFNIEGTRIDYPVMYKAGDNSFYLSHNFQKEDSISGTPFLDGNYDPLDSKQHLILYGYHMKDGSMFTDLMNYEKVDYYEKHKTIQLFLQENEYEYEVFAVCVISAIDDKELFYLPDSKEYGSYLADVKEKAVYETKNYPKNQERLLLLSACEYSKEEGSLVVLAKEKTK